MPSLNLDAEFAAFKPEQTTPLGYGYACFRCHTTGPASLAANGGLRQDNRTGIGGTWIEDGGGCEACHGPGSLHVPNPTAGNIEVTGASDACNNCHVNPDDPSLLGAADELVIGNQQSTEVAAGPHAGLACNVCHDPHSSTIRDPAVGVRNNCQSCHVQNMALHAGKVFRWGEFTETVTCTSCHMAPLARNASSTVIPVRSGPLRFGDTRTHIVTIRTGASGPAAMFSADGSQVARDPSGRAFVTSCQVCQRCHNGLGNAFAFPPGEECSLGPGIHDSR